MILVLAIGVRMLFDATFRLAGPLVFSALLAACGGGGGSDGNASATAAGCDVATENTWLRSHLLDAYYWSGASPSPEPGAYETVQKYFDAQRFAGAGGVPADRWSHIQDSVSFNRFFSEGSALGYGVSVNGIEGTLPLKVRFVEAASPAAATSVSRGQVILSVNGRSAADLVAAQDFSVLTPAAAGDVLTLVLEGAAGPRTVTLTAATYALTPVPVSTVLTLPGGGKAGYLVLKDFITQAEAPLAAALAGFREAGATELILDLRYNGGGRVSTANVLASLIAGASGNGKLFTRLNYNAKRAGSNADYTLAGGTGSAFARVVVLTGPRTCSASELVVNGLKPHMQVVTVGAASCGKPFGFNPVQHCASTYNAVNFEALNSLGQGRYYDGIAANCAATDDFNGALGLVTESLTVAAMNYLQSSVCAASTGDELKRGLSSRARQRRQPAESDERQGMWAE